jgi:CRP-like cAMP-binding protein
VVIEGRVKVYKLLPEEKEQTLHIVEQGEPFGEVAVFAGHTFPAFAQASSTTRELFFPGDAFVGLFKEDPSLTLNMLAMLSGRLRKITRLVEDLSLKEVPAGLAAYFLHLSDSAHGTDTISLDLAKGQLASLLGTIPETLSRILTRMAAVKLIETEGACIRIIDRVGLEEIARSEKKLA